MIRSVLYLAPRGDAGEIVDFYRRRRVLERACEQDGCLGAELQLPAEGTGAVLVTATWRDAAAYQGWLDNPDRTAGAEELAGLVQGFAEGIRGELYEVTLEARP